MLGYDTLFDSGMDDDDLIRVALKEGRVLLTRDTGIMRRRIVFTGKVSAILIASDDVREQLRQVVTVLNLELGSNLFSLCMECNEPLSPREKGDVSDLVPPYVFKTQEQYMQCPNCGRIYWRGTHWQAMRRELEDLS